MRVALLEKAKTPYRPPLFEYLGEYLDLTVYYVGTALDSRRWSVSYDAQNYDEKSIDTKHIGPFMAVPDLKERLRSGGYEEIIISAGPYMLMNSLFGASAASELDAQLTVWSESIHTPWKQGQGRSAPVKLAKRSFSGVISQLQRYLYSRADRIVAYSQLAKEAALSTGASREQVTVAPQWYPPEILAEPEPAVATDTYRVLYLGSLSRRKGVDVLLNVAHKYSNVEFVFAGDGPLRGEVATAANEHKRIHELGYIDEQQKAIELEAADLLILPSRHDPWGLVVNEAYIFDTPAITTTAAGAEMIVPESLTVPPGDPSALASAIEIACRDRPSAPSQPTIEAMADPLL